MSRLGLWLLGRPSRIAHFCKYALIVSAPRDLAKELQGNTRSRSPLASVLARRSQRPQHNSAELIFDKLHLNCGGAFTDNCYLPPVNGAVLQVMPWPIYRHMTDHQLTAIWTYLSTVPCNAHNDALGDMYPWLKNNCP